MLQDKLANAQHKYSTHRAATHRNIGSKRFIAAGKKKDPTSPKEMISTWFRSVPWATAAAVSAVVVPRGAYVAIGAISANHQMSRYPDTSLVVRVLRGLLLCSVYLESLGSNRARSLMNHHSPSATAAATAVKVGTGA
jgi:hypothetical protein